MIVFDLGCDHLHVFEAWFGSSSDYDDQRARGLIACPICGSGSVDKAAMAPRLTRKGNQQLASPRAPASEAQPLQAFPAALPAETPVAADAPAPEQVKAMLQMLAKAQTEMLKQSDYVGRRFSDEARAIHLGESDARSIHGQATPEEVRALADEGVPVAPLPFAIRPPGMDN